LALTCCKFIRVLQPSSFEPGASKGYARMA
jgi:hypothetical protein